jgi:hypothetical protein
VTKTSFNLPLTIVLQQALSVRRARSQIPKTDCQKNAHEHYHDLPKHCIHIFARQYREFWIASCGGCQPWTHFQDSLALREFLINWTMLNLAHSVRRAQAIPDPFALKIDRDLISSPFLKYAKRTSVTEICSFQFLLVAFSQTNPISLVMHLHATAVHMPFFPHVL